MKQYCKKAEVDFNLMEKAIRAEVIKEHMERRGIKKAVCFTCGNAAEFLRRAGVDVLAIGRNQDFEPTRWMTQDEIARDFPEHFNATSGDLPLFLMERIALKMRARIIQKFEGQGLMADVKVGSGETLLVLMLAFPKTNFRPYRENTPETRYDERATLNPILNLLFHGEQFGEGILRK